MLKRLSLDHRPPGKIPQRFSRCCHGSRDCPGAMTQQAFVHCLVKKRYAHAWTLYFGEEAKDRNTTNNIRTRIYKQSKFLQKLRLISYGTSDKAFRCFNQYFKGFVSVKSLSLNRPTSNRLTNTGLYHLSQGIKNLSSLESLDFKIASSSRPSFTDERLDILIRGLRIHISLRNMSLYFWRCDKITDLGIRNLCKDLKNLVFLQRLYLEFDSCDLISGGGLLEIQRLRKKLKKLKQVKIVWRYWKKISLIQIPDLLQIFEVFESPQNLTINFSSYSWKIMIDDLQIEIQFRDIKTEINNLMKLLHKFSETKDIDLKSQYFCKIHEDGFRRMSHTLTIISTNIKLLIDAEVIQEISDQFVQDFTNLKYLGFEYCKCKYRKTWRGRQIRNVDDFLKEIYEEACSLDNPHQILEKESEGLKSQVSIRNEFFPRGKGQKVGANDIKRMIQNLESTVNLEEFSLKLCSKDIWAKAGRKNLVKALRDHKSLQKANLEVGGDAEILEVQKEENRRGNESNSLFKNFLNKINNYCFWLCCKSHAN